MKQTAKFMATAFLCLIFSACEQMHVQPEGLLVMEVGCCETILVEDDCGALFLIVEAEGLDISSVKEGDQIMGTVEFLQEEVFLCDEECFQSIDAPIVALKPDSNS